MKKRIISMLLAGVMVLSLAACGGSGSGSSGESEGGAEASGEGMNIAMITDSGDITDQSFNQTTYESCKAWAEENGVEFTY